MRELRIVLTKSKKKIAIGSWVIRTYTGEKYSHCARGLTVYGDIDMYYQASEGKVNYENSKVFLKKHEVVEEYVLSIPDECYLEMSRACLEDAGVVYGTAQNLGIVYVHLMSKAFGKEVDNPWKKGRNCSELIYVDVFSNMFDDLKYNKDTIMPSDIKKIILDRFEEKDGIWIPKADLD